jgi:cellulose synthase/poly-beta-1,6-N-acetylglucosamine synthase-like glycosyltransferase
MQTLGLDVLRGKKQKPFKGEDYDVFVSIDSDVVFSPSQLIELIECTRLHPVVSGYYMMAGNKNFAVVKEWDKTYFLKNGVFKFTEPAELEPYVKRAIEYNNERKKAEEEKRDLPALREPEFINVSYVGLGFFACRKEVLDAMHYPYFHRDLQRMRSPDGSEIVDMCSEDVAFCKNIQDAGFDIMLHTTLRVGHEKSVVL